MLSLKNLAVQHTLIGTQQTTIEGNKRITLILNLHLKNIGKGEFLLLFLLHFFAFDIYDHSM